MDGRKPHHDVPCGTLTALRTLSKRGRPPHVFVTPHSSAADPVLSDLEESDACESTDNNKSSASSLDSLKSTPKRPRIPRGAIAASQPHSSHFLTPSEQASSTSLPFGRLAFEARQARAALANIILDDHRKAQKGPKQELQGIAETVHGAKIST